jgi:hypothetical protein
MKEKPKKRARPRVEEKAPPEPAPPEKAEAARHALLSPTATKLSASAGIIAAMVLATLVNLLVARHYRRWDVTRGGLYTLSDATLGTLHALPEPVKIYLILPGGEGLTLSVQHLLDGYRAETSKLDVDLVDPDRHPAELLSLAQRYGIGADREDGRLTAAAAAIVVAGDRREIIRPQDLVEVDAEDDLRRRPRLEQAFTGAIRAVTSGDHPTACFTGGHGEDPSEPLREHLAHNGYTIVEVEPARNGAPTSLDACKVLVVSGPTETVPAEDTKRWADYLEKGGAALVAAGPREGGTARGFTDYGLGGLLGSFGIALDGDLVIEADPHLRAAVGQGETFVVPPRPHPVTQSLVKLADRGVVPVISVASSLSTTGTGAAVATPLLVTSDLSFGMVDLEAQAKDVPGPGDKKGPLTVAFAAERAGKEHGKHGGRLVALGSRAALFGITWQREDLRGTALLVEGAIGWLTERPPILDIPQKPAFTAGLRVSDEWLAGTFRYVVVYMPFASMLIGFAVYLRRRGEKRGPSDKGAA